MITQSLDHIYILCCILLRSKLEPFSILTYACCTSFAFPCYLTVLKYKCEHKYIFRFVKEVSDFHKSNNLFELGFFQLRDSNIKCESDDFQTMNSDWASLPLGSVAVALASFISKILHNFSVSCS